MHLDNTILFLLSAIALFATPGPGVAAMVAIGREDGWKQGLKFYGGMQIGLALAAGAAAVGLVATISLFPMVLTAMSMTAASYLMYLAYRIATSPVGAHRSTATRSTSSFAGLLLGVTNPKAYFVFASLFASFLLVEANALLDGALKWIIVVVVNIVVDLVWLRIGARIGQMSLSMYSERPLNVGLASAIVFAAGFTLKPATEPMLQLASATPDFLREVHSGKAVDSNHQKRIETAVLADYAHDPKTKDRETRLSELVETSLNTSETVISDMQALLERAETDLIALRLTTPTGNNAWEHFTTRLENNPHDNRARTGLHAMLVHYTNLAKNAETKGEHNQVTAYMDKAYSVLFGVPVADN